jgi:phosphopentomutase
VPYRRVILLVLDGLGVGGAPDAAAFGDAGSDTLGHIALAERPALPNLAALGLGQLYPAGLPGLAHAATPTALVCRLTELSAGKDSTTGHWEMMGLVQTSPAPTFPHGFPADMLEEFSRRTGRGVLGNKVASGTQIIAELGPEQLATGSWIVYTSADSVFQIAAHVDPIPLAELYRGCEIARALLQGPQLGVDRVIARPFAGTVAAGFTRTPDRRDFSLEPPQRTILDELAAAGKAVRGVGKISDLFAGRGLTDSQPVHGNAAQQATALAAARDRSWAGLLFVNLVDFDMEYGHRNDPAGYAEALAAFDGWLGELLDGCGDDELVLITGDHGNDPTTPSTDHSREQVPLVLWSRSIAERGGGLLTVPPGFCHVGKTVAGQLGVATSQPGLDLLAESRSN